MSPVQFQIHTSSSVHLLHSVTNRKSNYLICIQAAGISNLLEIDKFYVDMKIEHARKGGVPEGTVRVMMRRDSIDFELQI